VSKKTEKQRKLEKNNWKNQTEPNRTETEKNQAKPEKNRAKPKNQAKLKNHAKPVWTGFCPKKQTTTGRFEPILIFFF